MKDLRSLADLLKKFNVILTKKQKKEGFLIFAFSLIGALAETLGVSVILPLVQVMLEPETLFENEVVSQVCNFLRISESKQLVILVAVFVIFIYILKNAYLCFLSWIRVRYTTKVQKELSVKMMRSYMKRGYTFFRQTNSATLLRGANESIASVYNVILMFMKILAEALTILCVFIFILYTDWLMAIGMVFLVGICLLTILSIFRNIMKKAGKMSHEGIGEVHRWSLQMFSGIKEVLVFNRKDYFVHNYEKSFQKLQKGRVRHTVAAEIPAYIIEGTCVAGIILAVCIRISFVSDSSDFVPTLATFAVAAFRLLPSAGKITSNFNVCIFSFPAVTEVYENMLEAKRYEEKLSEADKIESLSVDSEISLKEELVIDNIVWRYPDGEDNVLDHVSFTIKKGQSVALVGPSGAGKSTLADIILGLFKPQEGNVYVDGTIITNNELAVSKLISFVPQAVYLIDDTIRRNIAFGVEDEKIADEMIWKALEKAKMKEYILSLPKGLDTVVGERGVRFSGGQMQRLAIARALYTDPEILVLDEATSALDNETETAVMQAIDELQGEKTLIIIAHRLSTIKNCDKIYEIAGGKAIEKQYSELL